MGLTPAVFDVVISAQDPEVQCFKAAAQGTEFTMRRLGAKRERTLYVGDRPDMEIAAASRAGIPCAIIADNGSKSIVLSRIGGVDLR
jgi:FMN phosphatase YigB (HAD superfamily)